MDERQETIRVVRGLRSDAAGYVRAYAKQKLGGRSAGFVQALVRALGDISIEEALAAIDLEAAER